MLFSNLVSRLFSERFDDEKTVHEEHVEHAPEKNKIDGDSTRESTEDRTQEGSVHDNDVSETFPDGGLRAWLVVLGVGSGPRILI